MEVASLIFATMYLFDIECFLFRDELTCVRKSNLTQLAFNLKDLHNNSGLCLRGNIPTCHFEAQFQQYCSRSANHCLAPTPHPVMTGGGREGSSSNDAKTIALHPWFAPVLVCFPQRLLPHRVLSVGAYPGRNPPRSGRVASSDPILTVNDWLQRKTVLQ